MSALDRFQQRHRALAIAVAVGRKFGDDEGGNLTALIAYRAFFSLFPLLLLLTSVLGFVLADDPGLRKDAVDSVLGQFPVVGEQIRIGSLEGSGVALAVGIVGSLWAGLGVVLATGEALDRIWGVPRGERAGFLPPASARWRSSPSSAPSPSPRRSRPAWSAAAISAPFGAWPSRWPSTCWSSAPSSTS